ncbi:hypothetical protein SDC9_122401 [bioreactor metagenome]|uniref:Uncharacterized protein n=1 Tax=bioreactor metagenome TaxID=1076179 RepID=A0A645CES4_9ZZZZ
MEHGLFRDDDIDHALSRQREGAGLHDLGAAFFVRVLQHGNHLAGPGDQIHGAAHAGGILAGGNGHGPVGDVARLINLQCAQNGGVHMSAPDDSEGRVEIEDAGAGQQGDGLPAGVAEIGILLSQLGCGAEGEGAVFGLQEHVDPLGNEIGGGCGHSEAQVYNGAVLQLQGGSAGDLLSKIHSLVPPHVRPFSGGRFGPTGPLKSPPAAPGYAPEQRP